MRRYLPLLAAALLAAPAADAATLYTNQSLFNDALGGVPTDSRGFSGPEPGQIVNGVTFDNKMTIRLTDPSTDNNVVSGGVLDLSIDNSNVSNAITSSIELIFPTAVKAFSFDFGLQPVSSFSGSGRGPGNNSGTTLTAGDFTFNFSTLNGATPGYVGFFGVKADAGKTFSSVLFTSNGISDFADDDFTISNVQYAPVPLPAGLPLLAAGLGVFGLLKRLKG